MSQSSSQTDYIPYQQVGELIVQKRMSVARQASFSLFQDTKLITKLSGVQLNVCVSGITLTLPTTSIGHTFTIVNTVENGNFVITPSASDSIVGGGFNDGSEGQELAMKMGVIGDTITLVGDGVDGWVISNLIGSSSFQMI